MIKAVNLTKRFGARAAVDRLDFEIPRGQVVGFLGPNGAGKTTTMRLLTGYLSADQGRAEVLGCDIRCEPLAARRRMGYLPEGNPLYDGLEVVEALQFTALLRGMRDEGERLSRVKYVVKRCGLKPAIGKKAGELSKGFRQRLGLAQALVHNPDVLILDEPASGLDPNQIGEFRDLMRDLGKEKAILLSSHIIEQVVQTCDRVLIIHEGRIVRDDALERLGPTLAEIFREATHPS